MGEVRPGGEVKERGGQEGRAVVRRVEEGRCEEEV